jgi:hypothetical protein
LTESARENARRYLENQITVKNIGQAFAQAQIPSLLFKGSSLAQALYPEASWRHAGDIDILVPPEALHAAKTILGDQGFESADTLFALPGPVRALALRSARDFLFVHRRNRQKLELHTRLIFSKRVSRESGRLPGALEPRIPADGALPSPEVNAAFAHYLLLHGAVSGWARLKWLADMLPLLTRLDADQQRAIADNSERTHTAAAVKAGLVLLQTLFGGARLEPLKDWLRESAGTGLVNARVARYSAWLSQNEETAANPLHDRRAASVSAMLLNDRFIDKARLLVPAAFSSGMRMAGRLTARA